MASAPLKERSERADSHHMGDPAPRRPTAARSRFAMAEPAIPINASWEPGPMAVRLRAAWERMSWTTLAVGAVAGTLALWLGGGLGRLTVVAAAVASACCVAFAGQATGRFRGAWATFAGGIVLWPLSRPARPLWPVLSPDRAVAFGLDQIGALASTLLLAAGVLLILEHPTRLVARLRFLAEGLMIASSVLFASWVSIFPPAIDAARGRGLAVRAALYAFPVADVLLVAAVVFATTRIAQLGRWSILLLGGVGSLAILTTSGSAIGPGQSGRIHLIDLASTAALVLMVVAGWRWQRMHTGEEQSAAAARAQFLLLLTPGLSVLIVVGTTLRQVAGRPVGPELTWITIGVLGLGVLLHVTVVFENQALSGELALARDAAVLGSALKSRFLANVSHEIRTPMNAVIGLTGLLLDSELDEDQHELAVGVATSAEGLLSLIDGVLDFSKIEAQKMELEVIDLDLVDLLDDVALIVGDAARRKGLDLHAYCDPSLVTARRGDPMRLRQILLNLANNAVKFTAVGRVTISATAAAGPVDAVTFTVADTGIGIPPEEQTRLFEPFSQLDETTTRRYGGTGLGLGIVSGLVELQNGMLQVESEEGVGTVFEVTIPLPSNALHPTEAGLAALTGLRALVVDGNAVSRSFLAYTLHTWGFVVDQATTAHEALDQHTWTHGDQPPYAVVILDYRFEEMNGIQLATLLRRQPATAAAVMFLLGGSADLSRQAAHDARIESVLHKPVRTTYLLRRITDALVHRPSIDQPPRPETKPCIASS
jgi:two-component system sensor histidine kinase/response regulator